jgi:hypothetical protein
MNFSLYDWLGHEKKVWFDTIETQLLLQVLSSLAYSGVLKLGHRACK